MNHEVLVLGDLSFIYYTINIQSCERALAWGVVVYSTYLTSTFEQTPFTLASTHAHGCSRHMRSSRRPCTRTYIMTTARTSKIKLHLPVWDALITSTSVGIQSKSKLCPTKTAPLISSPIKSISCSCAYFRHFISPVVSSNRPEQDFHLRVPPCLSGVLHGSLMLLSTFAPLPMIIRAILLAFPILTSGFQKIVALLFYLFFSQL